jgi:hypothetical protein
MKAVAGGDGTLEKWQILHGDETPLDQLYKISYMIENYLNWLCSTQNPGHVAHDGARELSEQLKYLTINYFNENYVFTIMEEQPESIVPFIVLEIFEASRLKLQIRKCDSCGIYYVKQKYHQYNLCNNQKTCPRPSRKPISILSKMEYKKRKEDKKNYMREYRENKRKKHALKGKKIPSRLKRHVNKLVQQSIFFQ